jgi:cyclophilin family peptidyl-prolyl cis-trans isomerase
MPRPIRGVWNLLHNRKPARAGQPAMSRFARPRLESLEDRVTPTATQVHILANGVISGFVYAGGGGSAMPGVVVTLTGETTTGRTVDVNSTTNSSGGYTFNSVLPGTYSVMRGSDPNGFTGGDVTLRSNIVIGEGQSNTGNNLNVGGLDASRVSLAYFVSGFNGVSPALPGAGAGTAAGFSLNSAEALTAQAIAIGSTTYLDLSGNFFDPDTTDTTVTFNTSQGSYNVQLFDTDAPQTVANFLDYVAAGDYTNVLFHRMSNLSQTTAETPPVTPYQVLQAGGFNVSTDANDNITAINALTTFQPIANEFSSNHLDGIGTLAMARTSSPNSGTSQFFFNLTDNSQELNSSNGGGFAVFGKVTDQTSTTTLQDTALKNFDTMYTPTDVSTATGNSALVTVPLVNGFTPASNFPTGATTADVALINSITIATPSKGHLTYKLVSNSNPSVLTVTPGQNTSSSTFDANQLQLKGLKAGSSVVTLQVTDERGETVTTQFTVTVQ